MPRYAILADQNFNYILSKTGNAILRYRPYQAVCIIDSETAGKTAQDVLGYGGDIPVVANIQEALPYSPDSLLIAIAPQGGELPKSWREILYFAIKSGMNIVSGLHTFLSEDREFTHLAAQYGVKIKDLRKPPDPLPFSRGSWRWRKTPVLLTVGSDCDTGKMTTAWEIKQLMEKKGMEVVFIGTGQTGILLAERGVAVDAVVSDFIAGCIEAEIDRINKEVDLVVVEGQGSLNHMAYSGVTLGLLHGTMPDFLVMCHEPNRERDTIEHPIPPLGELLDLHLRLMEPFKKSEVVGISLLTHRMSDQEAKHAIREIEKLYQIPTSDIIRFGGEKIINRILYSLANLSS